MDSVMLYLIMATLFFCIVYPPVGLVLAVVTIVLGFFVANG